MTTPGKGNVGDSSPLSPGDAHGWSDGITSSMYKCPGARVGLVTEPVRSDEVVIETGVVCVRMAGSSHFKKKVNGDP